MGRGNPFAGLFQATDTSGELRAIAEANKSRAGAYNNIVNSLDDVGNQAQAHGLKLGTNEIINAQEGETGVATLQKLRAMIADRGLGGTDAANAALERQGSINTDSQVMSLAQKKAAMQDDNDLSTFTTGLNNDFAEQNSYEEQQAVKNEGYIPNFFDASQGTPISFETAQKISEYTNGDAAKLKNKFYAKFDRDATDAEFNALAAQGLDSNGKILSIFKGDGDITNIDTIVDQYHKKSKRQKEIRNGLNSNKAVRQAELDRQIKLATDNRAIVGLERINNNRRRLVGQNVDAATMDKSSWDDAIASRKQILAAREAANNKINPVTLADNTKKKVESNAINKEKDKIDELTKVGSSYFGANINVPESDNGYKGIYQRMAEGISNLGDRIAGSGERNRLKDAQIAQDRIDGKRPINTIINAVSNLFSDDNSSNNPVQTTENAKSEKIRLEAGYQKALDKAKNSRKSVEQLRKEASVIRSKSPAKKFESFDKDILKLIAIEEAIKLKLDNK